jgi:glycosyltransferase involved in cell wall biosynthesis
MPKVDVIIPTYNRSELLHSAITSVLNQTYQDFEIIVVDDCSEDDTPKVIKNFENHKIRSIRHGTNQGEGRARNTGILNSNAEYVAFLDDDDEWVPEKLYLEVDLLEKASPQVGGVYTGYLAVDKVTGETLDQRIPELRGDIYKQMIRENVVGTSSTVLVRKECFNGVGLFDESVVWGLDYDMWIRIAKQFHFEYIEEPLVKYHVHANQISNNTDLKIRGMEALLKKYERFFAEDRKQFSQHYRDLGSLCCENGRPLKAQVAFLKAIGLYPFEIRNYYDLGLSLFGAKNFFRFKKAKKKVINFFRPDRIFRANQRTRG